MANVTKAAVTPDDVNSPNFASPVVNVLKQVLMDFAKMR
jgi:hypothetical protein